MGKAEKWDEEQLDTFQDQKTNKQTKKPRKDMEKRRRWGIIQRTG